MADPEVRVEPDELARASQAYLNASQDLFDALRALRADAPISTTDFGSVQQAEGLVGKHDSVLGLAGTLFERVIGVLEVDADSLLRVAFAYQEADREAAERVTIPTRGAY